MLFRWNSSPHNIFWGNLGTAGEILTKSRGKLVHDDVKIGKNQKMTMSN